MAVTRADLNGWGRKAEKHWRTFLPAMVKQLEAEGRLYEVLVQVEEDANLTLGQLLKKGVPAEEAILEMEREHLILDPRAYGEVDEETTEPQESTTA